MLLVRWSLFHRLMAAVLAICFSLFTAELAIADVHDGDAEPAAASQTPSHTQPRLAEAPTAPHHSTDRSPEHSAHVCHCVHAHGELPASTVILHHAPQPAAVVISTVAQAPAAVVLEPRLRPPIA